MMEAKTPPKGKINPGFSVLKTRKNEQKLKKGRLAAIPSDTEDGSKNRLFGPKKACKSPGQRDQTEKGQTNPNTVQPSLAKTTLNLTNLPIVKRSNGD